MSTEGKISSIEIKQCVNEKEDQQKNSFEAIDMWISHKSKAFFFSKAEDDEEIQQPQLRTYDHIFSLIRISVHTQHADSALIRFSLEKLINAD